MKLHEAIATKKPFHRLPSGRVIEHAESCGLRFFRFQKPIAGQTKEPVIFPPEDFEIEWGVVEEKKEPTLHELDLDACDKLKRAIQAMGEAKSA